MNCASCGMQCPAGMTNCPACGAPLPYYHPAMGMTPPRPPFPGGDVEQKPAAAYGAMAYSAPPPPPPNLAQAPAQPRSRFQGQGKLMSLFVGLVVLALVIATGGLIRLLPRLEPGKQGLSPTATVKATPTLRGGDPYTHSGTFTFSDPLSDNSRGHKWSEYTVNCAFRGGAYHDMAPDANYDDYCLAYATNFSNFVYEVQMKIIKGDAGGLVFRTTSTNPTNEFYVFIVGQNGFYDLVVTETNTGLGPSIAEGFSPVIKKGLNQTNALAVVAQGNNFTLYVNHQRIASAADNTYSHGTIGVFAYPFTSPTEVVYSNAQLWTL